MSKKITLELPEKVYFGLERTAAAQGQALSDWLRERIEILVPDSPETEATAEEAEPEFWHLPDIDMELEALEAQNAAHHTPNLNAEAARATTNAMVRRWFGNPMTEAEALELATSEDIHEWNLA